MQEAEFYGQYTNLGETLRQKRTLLDLSLEEVQGKTRIRTAFLKALENGHYHELPADVYVLGYLRALSKLYALELSRLTELYKKEQTLGRKIGQNDFKPQMTIKNFFIVTPKSVIAFSLVTLFLAAVGYIGWQISQVTAAPKLSVESPGTEAVIQSNVIDIKGHTEPGSTLTINNQTVPIERDGSFSQSLYLSDGENQIIIRSSNRFNHTSEVKRRVVVGTLPEILGESTENNAAENSSTQPINPK